MRCNKNISYLFLGLLVFVSLPVNAGFLDMPEVLEAPDLVRKSMLRDLDIPGVKDRDPDPTAGPRLAVKEFRVQGLAEYPELGITREAINKLVEKIRFDLMAEDKLLDSGYTLDELGGLSDLLVDIEEDTIKRHVTPIEVQKLVWLIRDQRLKRGITLGQIESIADKITSFYRERGFILAKAYIPKQEVRDGIVTLTLLLGMLGSVEVVNNKIYSTSTIDSVFDDMLTKPVTSQQVEENLYLINDFPGITVNGFFSPGYQVGDTKLNINVQTEDKTNSNIRLDNHGTEGTGQFRAYADFQVNSLFGYADRLKLGLLYASSPSNTDYWKFDYQTKFFSPRWRFLVGASSNQFILDQSSSLASLNLTGTVDVVEYGLQYILTRSRLKNYIFEIKFDNMDSTLQIGDFSANILEEKIINSSFIFSFDLLSEKDQRLQTGNIRFLSGNLKEGATINQEEKFKIITADYQLLTFWKVPFTDSISRLIVRANLQYSGINLSSLVRFSIAGPSRARAYSSDVFSGDDAIYAGIDWVFNAPDFFDFKLFDNTSFKDIAKPFFFLDLAAGKQYTLVANNDDVTGQLVNAGFGVQLAKANFSGNLQIAIPLVSKISDPVLEIKKEGVRVVFDFQYKF